MKILWWLLLICGLLITMPGSVEREHPMPHMGQAGSKFTPEWPVDYIPGQYMPQ